MTDALADDVVATDLGRAEALLDVGRPADALTLLALLPPLAAVCFLRASALYDLADYSGSSREAKQGLAEEPDNRWGLLLLAETMLARGRSKEAADTVRAALASAGPFPQGLVLLSSAQRAQQQSAAAVLSAQQAVELGPLLPVTHAALSRARHDAGDLAGAEAAARQAVALGPHDPDALSALAEHLERSFRLTEAQEVRLRAVAVSPGQAEVDALGQVVVVALPLVLGLNAGLPLVMVAQADLTANDALPAAVLTDALVTGAYLLLRRVVQRSLTGVQRRGLRPARQLQNRMLLLSAALPFLLLLPWLSWQAVHGTIAWDSVAIGLALVGALVLVAHRIAPLHVPRIDWAEVIAVLRRDSGWRAIRTRVREDRKAHRQLREQSRGAPSEDATMYLRNARFVNHVYFPVGAALLAAVSHSNAAGWLFLLVAVAADAVLTDLVWPRLASRYDPLWRLTRFHLRVVDARTGRAPSVGRSALRGVLRFLLCPVELPRAFRRRRETDVVLHDRLTRTRVVRLP